MKRGISAVVIIALLLTGFSVFKNDIAMVLFKRAITHIQHQWLRILKDAGVARCRVHDLRHTFASMLVNGGTSLYAVSKLLGHADPAITQRYAHLTQETLREESTRLGQSLLETLESAADSTSLVALPDAGDEAA